MWDIKNYYKNAKNTNFEILTPNYLITLFYSKII